jgi:hypothetical protein
MHFKVNDCDLGTKLCHDSDWSEGELQLLSRLLLAGIRNCVWVHVEKDGYDVDHIAEVDRVAIYEMCETLDVEDNLLWTSMM